MVARKSKRDSFCQGRGKGRVLTSRIPFEMTFFLNIEHRDEKVAWDWEI